MTSTNRCSPRMMFSRWWMIQTPKFLIMHCILFWQSCNCCTIAYTQHKHDFMSCMWGGLHQLHTYSICSVYAVHVRYVSGAEAAFTQESATDPWLFTTDNIYPLFWFQIQTWLLKMLFLHCDSFLHSPVIQSFIHSKKCWVVSTQLWVKYGLTQLLG